MEEKKSAENYFNENQSSIEKKPNEFHTEEKVTETKTWGFKNFLLAFFVLGVFLLIGFISSGTILTANIEKVILWTVLCILYAIILYFLLEPGVTREISKKEIRTVDNEIIRNIPVIKRVEVEKRVEVPVEKEVAVIREVKVPVIKEIQVPVEKKVFIPTDVPKRSSSPSYEFVASSSAKTFHKNSCRLSKSIKRKYKEFSNDSRVFRRKGYDACKICILTKGRRN